MAVQMLGIKTKFTDDQGRPLIGGSVHTYYAGTSLPQDTFSDPELTVPNTNPVKLDDTGSANIFLKGTYRVRVFDRKGKFVEEQDNVSQLASKTETNDILNKVTVATDNINKHAEKLGQLAETEELAKKSMYKAATMSEFEAIEKQPESVLLVEYHLGSGKGSGLFKKVDTGEPHNGGHVIHTAGGAVYQRQTDVLKWEDFGLYDGSPLLTQENCQNAFKWGLSKGFTRFVTSQEPITLPFDFAVNIPSNYPHDKLYIDSSGEHKFNIDLAKYSTVTPNLYRVTGNDRTVLDLNINFNNEGVVLAQPMPPNAPWACRIENCPDALLNVKGKNHFGFGVFLTTSPRSQLSVYARNVDGYNTTKDNYGDAVYIASEDVTVTYADIETNRGGRAGIVFEGTLVPSNNVGGTVGNFRIVGYDRGLHYETLSGKIGKVSLVNGEIINCNTSVCAFCTGTKGFVDITNVKMTYTKSVTQSFSEGFSDGHFFISGCDINTFNCTFGEHTEKGNIVKGSWISNNDIFSSGFPGLSPSDGTVKLYGLDASKCKAEIKLLYSPTVVNSLLGGDLRVDYSAPLTYIDNVRFVGDANNPSGKLWHRGNTKTGIYRNITFDYIKDFGIENSTNNWAVNEQPVYENIRALEGASGSMLLHYSNSPRIQFVGAKCWISNVDGVTYYPSA